MNENGSKTTNDRKLVKEQMQRRLVTLDWAIKRLLRSKANFDILEGFLSELLKEDVQILEVLEAGAIRDWEDHKCNRIDLKVKLSDDKIAIIELQARLEADFLQRLLWATSRMISEHMHPGALDHEVSKVICVGILHFDLGTGDDYVYHGQTSFQEMRRPDQISPDAMHGRRQPMEKFAAVFPEYFLIKMNEFDDIIRNTLDEWIYTLKHGRTPENFSAKGLARAKEVLDVTRLSDSDLAEYEACLITET